MLTTQSPENSPPFYAVPTTHMMPEGFFTYHYAHLPIVFIEPAKELPYMESMLDRETPMEEEIDVETVEESLPAADLLKQRLSRESVPESSSSLPSCSYTSLEPIRSSSLDQPITDPKSPYTGDHSSEDDDLSRFTPRNSLREIEEHGQYDSSRDKERKFKCQYCVKRFVRKEEKLRHERSHTNDRKYKCRICNLRFLRADHRKGHEETHSDVKRFKCEPCNKSFRRKDEFNRHCQRKICKANKVKKEQ